jgi:two-component system, cell cycle response regulator DivK
VSDPAARRILLVEDNQTIRNAFAILLEESGYEVVHAGTGEEAMAAARSRSPDLILMDLGLPDIGGLEVTRSLKADPATRDITIVALTGRALETDERACIAAGCSGYLSKPIDTAQLLRKIPEFIRNSARSAGGA